MTVRLTHETIKRLAKALQKQNGALEWWREVCRGRAIAWLNALDVTSSRYDTCQQPESELYLTQHTLRAVQLRRDESQTTKIPTPKIANRCVSKRCNGRQPGALNLSTPQSRTELKWTIGNSDGVLIENESQLRPNTVVRSTR